MTKAEDLVVSPATSALLDALAQGLQVHDLGHPMFVGMPQSPNHPPFRMVLERRHGDMVRSDGSSASNEIIVTGGHVGTHIDALSHVSFEGHIFNGIDCHDAVVGGKFAVYGAETIAPIVRRGILLDVPGALGLPGLSGGHEITPDELDETVRSQGIEIAPGDAVLIRSGWGQHFDNKEQFIGAATGVPGVSLAGAQWLIEKGAGIVGADTIAFEMLPAAAGHSLLPAHKFLLVDTGVHIIETLDLEGIAASGVHEFMFVCSPLKLVGATGSPVRPIAISGSRGDLPL